ncbi:glutamate receptor 2.1-like [Canna indica]|uniref:Glutamate receptor n=1 Tax=Canna indica TaxID=4628 RepID=A0AAQ3KUY2_9LILI|nr:glutamate receptor 2.1-like [Canna indica]
MHNHPFCILIPLILLHITYKASPQEAQVMNSIILLLLLSHGVPKKIMADDKSSSSFATVQVGVILDMDTWIGTLGWSCISMAVDDFYAMHPNSSTRLKLHLKSSQGDVVSAASAALTLFNDIKVEAIIGPQSSEQAKFVAELGSKFQIPILSFSATSPLLSPRRFPYYVRTTFNDSIQAKVIVELVQSFGWRKVILIFEDSDYGYGILPYLIENFQMLDIQIPHKRAILVSTTNKQIQEELHLLRNIQSRIFIVHASLELSHRITLMAKKENMMTEGYAWIMTCGLADYLSLMNFSSIDAMQGILSISQYVPESQKINDFMVRWHKKFYHNNQSFKVNQLGSFGLLAYDTTWALAMAAETASLSSSGHEINMTKPKTLLNVISNMKYDGISGKFSMENAQLNVTTFQIVNVIGNWGKKIGLWTSANGFSKSMNSKKILTGILWPGDSLSIPKTLAVPPKDSMLRIAVPITTFSELVNYEWNPRTQRNGSGFCIEVFDLVMASLDDAPSYEYIMFNHSGSYDDLVYQVYIQKFDAVVGDVTINANRSLYVDFTVPFVGQEGVSILVPKYGLRKSAWIFLKPLKPGLWLAIGVFIIFTGIVVWVLEHRINEEFRGTPVNQFGTILFFSFSTLVFAHSLVISPYSSEPTLYTVYITDICKKFYLGEKIKSNMARVVVIVWVFVVLILQSSYTASLTSMLTVEQLHPAFTNLNDLIKNGDYIGYHADSPVQNLLRADRSKLRAYDSVKEYDEALRGSSRGGVSAIVDETPYIEILSKVYPDKYTMVGPIYQTNGFGFVFPKGSPLVPNISKVILKSTNEIEKLYMNMIADTESKTGNSPSLELGSFGGLFIITGITSMSTLISYIIIFLNQHWHVLSSSSEDKSVRGRFATMAKLFDQKSYTTTFANNEPKEGPQGNENPELTPNLSSHTCEISYQGEEGMVEKDTAIET